MLREYSMNTTHCIFCNIITKSIPSYIVYEDNMCIGFLDIAPITKGHTLLVPKVHCSNILDFDLHYSESVMHGLQIVSNAITKALSVEGIQILQNNGSGAGQMVFHIHWHIIPRYADDGLNHWQGKATPHKAELQGIADSIISNL